MAMLPYGELTYPEKGFTRPGLGGGAGMPAGQLPTQWQWGAGAAADYGGYPIYKAEPAPSGVISMPTIPGAPGAVPTAQPLPTYQPGTAPYPITQLPTYKPTEEAYPGYEAPPGELSEELMASIRERMTGAGTAGAESAIYERGEERVEREYEEGLKRIDEQMSARGLTGSGIHGEAVSKLEEERQRSLADLSRQITIYGQQAIESAMAKGQQYVEYQSAEAARELAVGERGWQARTQEQIGKYESEAKAAEVAGRSEEAAFNTAIAERVRAYEAQARAAQAKNTASMQEWQAKAGLYMQRYQLEMQKAQFLQQAKMQAWQAGRDEYQRVYQSKYQATRDKWLAEQAAEEAALKREQFEWQKAQVEAERRAKIIQAAYGTGGAFASLREAEATPMVSTPSIGGYGGYGAGTAGEGAEYSPTIGGYPPGYGPYGEATGYAGTPTYGGYPPGYGPYGGGA